MPELLVYPVGEPQRLNDVEATEFATRKTDIERNKRYYAGDQKRPLIVKAGQADDNVIINLAQRVVDQSVSMLAGEAPEFALANENGQSDLDDWWEENDKDDFLHGVAVTGGVAGHVFIKLLRESDGALRLVNLHPELISVFWLPDDIRKVVCYKIEWTKGKVTHREDIYRQDEKNWVIQPYTKTDGASWMSGAPVLWQFAFAPIVDWQNLPNQDGYYGQTDLLNIGINDAVNFVASNINRILKYHAHPRTIGIGLEKDQIKETAVDGFWSISNPDAKISNLEMQSDLASSMAFLEYLQGSFYSQHRAVDLASMKDRIGQLTNFGLRMLFKDALDKTRVKQTLYGEGLEYLCERAGEILGFDFSEVQITWADPLPFNDREEIEGLEKELGLGIVSKQTAAEMRGRDWEMEKERMQAEKASDQLGLGAVLASAMRGFDSGQGNLSPGPFPTGKGSKEGKRSRVNNRTEEVVNG